MQVIQICLSCSMLCTDGLLLHLVGKRQLLVYSGASYSNGKLGDSIWESHRKSSAQGTRRQTLPQGAKGHFNDYEVGANCMVLLIVVCLWEGGVFMHCLWPMCLLSRVAFLGEGKNQDVPE